MCLDVCVGSLTTRQHKKAASYVENVGGAVASWLVPSTPDRAVWVRVLAGCMGTLCCVLGQDTLFSHYLSPPRRINGYRRARGNPAMDEHPI